MPCDDAVSYTEEASGTLRLSPRARPHSAGASASGLLDCFARFGLFAGTNWMSGGQSRIYTKPYSCLLDEIRLFKGRKVDS
jgi:hypothetical protein